jgi:3-hydroxyacyl-CoA dehydrogenase
VTEVAAGCERPERVGGLHFFNPPPLMRLVEVIGGLRSDPALVEALVGYVKRINKHPVVAADTPGFIVNHAGRAYGPEALRIVSQGIASPREVDLLMREAAGFRMGPFELLDLVGGDVAHAVMVSIFEQYFDDPMYQPSANMAIRVAGGLLGRKTRRGFTTMTVSRGPTDGSGVTAGDTEIGMGRRRRWRPGAGELAERSRREDRARRQAVLERPLFCHTAGRGRFECERSPQSQPRAHDCRRYVRCFPGTAYVDENAVDQRGNAWRCVRGDVG